MEVPNIHRQFNEQLWKIDLCFFPLPYDLFCPTCLRYMVKLPLTPTLKPPAREFKCKLKLLQKVRLWGRTCTTDQIS